MKKRLKNNNQEDYSIDGNLASRKRNPQAVNTLIDGIFKKFGLEDKIAQYQFVKHWHEIVGNDIAQRSRPISLKNNTLVVEVTNSAWAQELSFQAQIIINRLQKFLGDKDTVKEVRFIVQK